jgi:hypothetical protein
MPVAHERRDFQETSMHLPHTLHCARHAFGRFGLNSLQASSVRQRLHTPTPPEGDPQVPPRTPPAIDPDPLPDDPLDNPGDAPEGDPPTKPPPLHACAWCSQLASS